MSKALRINEAIRISPVRVIDQDHNQLGVISVQEAQNLAREAGLDLVEVSPTERPPVCRIMDYGKFKYDRKKRQKQASGGAISSTKELRLRPKTDPHDRDIKTHKARDFLAEGHKVQFTMLFKGRERMHQNRAVETMEHILEVLGEEVRVERRPAMEGRRMTMIVAPQKASSKTGPKQSAPKESTEQESPKKKTTSKPESALPSESA